MRPNHRWTRAALGYADAGRPVNSCNLQQSAPPSASPPRAGYRRSIVRLWALTPLVLLIVCALVAGRTAAWAGTALVAVASNFQSTATLLQAPFEEETVHRITVISGATGKIFAQIGLGAPYDVFLSADEARAKRLEDEGLAVAGTRFAYVFGRLALWSAEAERFGTLETPDTPPGALRRGTYRTLGLAQPDLAPYGRAAAQTLEALGLDPSPSAASGGGRRIYGENVGQVFTLLATGNADMGFVALAQVRAWAASGKPPGSLWIVPPALHGPIRQDAVLLARAKDNDAARAFLAFLAGGEARAIMEQAGYRVPRR